MSMVPASEDPLDKLVADWTEHTLTRSKGGIRKIGENILLFSLTNGHALNEKVYQIGHAKKFEHMFPHGYVGLKTLKIKKPEDYKLEVDQFRNIRSVWSNRASRRFDPSYFIISSFMPMYENPAGTSDLRAAIRAYNLITLAQQLRAIWCEQFSMPLMEGTYPDGDNDAKKFVEDAIQHVRALGWMVVPQGTTIRAIEMSTRGESEFQAMIDDLRKEIYLCIVGSYLQAIEGDTVGGAGNSETHRSTFELFQWYLCEFLAEQINDQLIPDLVGLNFSGVEPPRVSFAGVTDGDLLQSASVYQAIKTLGLDLSKKKLREKFQIDAPVDEADTIKGEQGQPAGGGMGGGLPGSGPDGAAPDPLKALNMAEATPVGERFASGAQVLWKATKFFDRVRLSDVGLAREMCVGEDGLTDYGTLMRTAKYHGINYKDIENPSVFDLEDDINDPDRLVLTTMTDESKQSTSFVLLTQCKLAEGYVSILTADGQEQLDPETFLERWPGVTSEGKPASRRAVIFSLDKPEEKDPEPEKHSDGDDDAETASRAGVGANRVPVAPDDMPAGPDGKDVYKLLNQCKTDGAKIVADMAKKAATRMLKSGETETFFTDDELQELSESLEEFMAPADLLGRASVLIRHEKAKQQDDVTRFSEKACGIPEKFADARLRPMKPASALSYFRSLVPSMNLDVKRWGDSLRRKTFTMAEATNKIILNKVQKVIASRAAAGLATYGPAAVEDVLVKAGIHPKNPQYPEMVFRTNYMDMLNVAAEEQRLDPDIVDDFPVWRYMGIRDGRQGKDHEQHFDQYFSNKVKFHEVRGERIFNCRCQPVPVYKSEWKRLKANGKRVTKFGEEFELVTLDHDGKVVKLSEVKYEELSGGLADGKADAEFNQDDLNAGILIEMEHTDDKQVATEIAKDHLTEDPEYYNKLPAIEQMAEETHDYCSTQFNLPHVIALKVMGEADRIKDEDLAEKGREDDPHITVLYGIHDDSCREKLGEMLKSIRPIDAKIKHTDVFEKDDCDVVVALVYSPDLHLLRQKVEAICENTQTYPDYVPHITLAYVQKGMGQKYKALNGLAETEIKLSQFCFCSNDESKTVFRLGGDPSKFAEIYHGPKPPGDIKDWKPLQAGPKGGKRWEHIGKGKAPTEDKGKGKGDKKPAAAGKSKAPGSQMKEQDKKRLRDLGMVGTFPPHDVPLEAIKIHQGSKEDLQYKPLMQWDQKTKSGRISRQYRYTQEFHDRNAAAKFDRVMAVEPHLEKAKKVFDKIIGSDNETWERRDAAAIVAIIAETGLRPTDGADSVKHGHFGIASLQSRHCKIIGKEVHLDFIGKEGVRNRTVIRNPVVVEHMKHTLETSNDPKEPLWLVGSDKAAAVLKETIAKVGGPKDVMLKDLRTIKATQTAKQVVGTFKGPPPPLTGDAKKDGKMVSVAILKMSDVVSKVLNNTATQARDNYIHPEVFKTWQSQLAQHSNSKKAKG
jgi:DNA topoisomerase IB/2'-5' RNA ligase